MEKARTIPETKVSLTDADRKALKTLLDRESFEKGSQVEAYEKAITERVGAEFAVAFNSNMSAFSAAYFALDLTKYDRVFISQKRSVFASAYPHSVRAKVEVVDFADLDRIAEEINIEASRGKEILVPMHRSDHLVDMEPLSGMIQRSSTVVIEDASLIDVKSCQFSDCTILDFVVACHDPNIAEKLKHYRDYGTMEVLDSVEGGAYRCHELQAVLAIHKLK